MNKRPEHDAASRVIQPLAHVGSRSPIANESRSASAAPNRYPAGGGSAEIVVWTNGVPTSTGFDDDTYFAHGIGSGGPWVRVLISARAGNEVIQWMDGAVLVLGHPEQSGLGSYTVEGTSNNSKIVYKLEVSEPLVSHRFGNAGSRNFEALSVLPIDRCIVENVCTSPMRQYPFNVTRASRPVAAVNDLTVTVNGSTSITLNWTQVDDGTGNPARYRVKYAEPPLSTDSWSSAAKGCDVVGNAIGAMASCTVTGLAPNTPYDFTLMSYRLDGSTWANAIYSNMAVGQTGWTGGGGPPPPSAPGVMADLSASGTTASTVTLNWTQVDGGAGSPAWYRVKYAEPNNDRRAGVGHDL